MKKLLLLIILSASYFYLYAQNHQFDSKKSDPCKIITADKMPQGVMAYSTNVFAYRPKFKLFYDKYVGPKSVWTTYYQLELKIAVLTNLPTVRGIVIFLKNGQKLSKPQENVYTESRAEDGFMRIALIKLTDNDLAMLKQSPITSFKLYDANVHVDKPELYWELLNCLVTKE